MLAEVLTLLKRVKSLDTLNRICDLAEEPGVVFTLENLNLPVDHSGVPFAWAEETRALVSAVDHPQLRLNLDLYHAQIGDANLFELCRACLPWIGEVQVADVPGRCQPGTGEINYTVIARALTAMGFNGPVGMEAFASGSPEEALLAFISAFSQEAATCFGLRADHATRLKADWQCTIGRVSLLADPRPMCDPDTGRHTSFRDAAPAPYGSPRFGAESPP